MYGGIQLVETRGARHQVLTERIAQWILAIMTRTGSSVSNGFGEDRIFTVTEEIVGYGASPWEGKGIT